MKLLVEMNFFPETILKSSEKKLQGMFGWKEFITWDKKDVIEYESQNMNKVSNNLSIFCNVKM